MAFAVTRSARPAIGSHRAAPRMRARSIVAPKASLTLYTNPRSRGRIVEWYLKELGVDAELVNIEFSEKQHKSPEFMQVNPFGKVPALKDGDLNLFESGAMLLYLADKYAPGSTPETRARASAWVLFANSTMSNSVFVEQFREKSMPDVFGNLNRILGEQEYLEGDQFTVADVAVGAYLMYIPAFFPDMDLSAWPNVVSYMHRLAVRPACSETVGSRVAAMLKEKAAAAQ